MVNIIQWKNVINSCVYDDSVGIKIAKLTGDERFSTFITEIDTKKSVNLHYHKNGEEHYHIISGNGEIYLKNIVTGKEYVYSVSDQESFVVSENMLHKLTNTGKTPLLLMFSCPLSHLESDRYFL